MPKNQSPKILYLVTLSEWGGAQKYVFDLASTLKEQGYSVEVALGGEQNGQLIQKLLKLNIKTYYLKNLQRPVNFYRDWLVLWELVKLFRKIKPDILHLNSSKASALGAIAGKLVKIKKIIYTVHGLVLNEPLALHKKIFYLFSEWLSAKFKNQLICVSQFDKESLLKHKIAKAQKITVIYNGIDLDNLKFFTKNEAREKLSLIIQHKLLISNYQLPISNYLIGTIANFYPTKGLTYLIEAAKQSLAILPDLKFIIIGDGPERRKLTELISKYKLEQNVLLTGNLPQASQYLKAFDLFVLPSVKEGLSYTLIEAQAAGLPIITTRVGGTPEIVENNKTGIKIPAKDFNALAENIINLINHPAKQKKIAQNALSNCQKFSLNKMIQATKKTYGL
jgi:glycosyltransferase involved in cell wall biosynthesis